MVHVRLKQFLLLAGAVAAIAVSASVTRFVWGESGLRAVQAVNEQRLQLVANAVRAEVGRQDHLPVVLSLDPDVRAALAAPSNRDLMAQLSRKLARLSLEADTRSLHVTDVSGIVVASDNAQAPNTLVGHDLSNQPYIINTLAFGKSAYVGVDPESKHARYYLAEAVRDGAKLLGIAVVRIEFDSLEATWERAAERVLVTDSAGIVFLASDPAFKFRRLGVASEDGDRDLVRRYPGMLRDPINLTVLEQRGADSIVRVDLPDQDHTYLYQSARLPAYGWTVHRFSDLSSVQEDRRDGAIIGAAISALFFALLLYVVQRHRAYLIEREAGARLKSEVAERTHELSEINNSLQTEIDEHRRTEARLRTTQNELVQAGKLAALGQMSAAIAHEINQPLAAIRTFMASAKVFAQRNDIGQVVHNLDLITGLAERMASITGHLKMFARKSEPGHPEPVSVDKAIEGTFFLLESQIASAGVRIVKEIEPDLWVMGHAVQLEQVILNLVRNALDAVAGRDAARVCIWARATDGTVLIGIADNGPGIAPDRLDQIFDPFFTSKPVGEGLGLGLSISYGIVQNFGGHISARNLPEGGAELIVELPRHRVEVASTEAAAHV